ncbi:tail fiber protein [Paenibacillus amylolyticus]|uniref:tail fiber protein n=2 Tax=Bacillales TaxID=1385 RepID=UPI0033995DD6
MANRYANLVGSKKINEDFGNINIGFDRVQAEMDTKGTPADAQAKADAAKTAAIAASAADLAAHKARGADEHPTAKGNAAGFQSAADKLKSDASTSAATPDTLMQRDTEGRAKVAAPAAADDIARKAETDAVQSNLDSHTGDTVKHVTQAEHDKLNGIAAGAEVNQNAFSMINDVSAGSKTDTVTLVGGTGVVITTDPDNKRISFTITGESTPGAHALSHLPGGTDVIPNAVTGGLSGLMSGADAKFVRQDGETKTGAQAKADAVKEYVDEQISAIPPVNDASQTEKGITMLSDATDGIRSNVAATEKAVGLAFQAGVERKAEVVAALNSIGVSASTNESWGTLITKMSGVIRSTGTATVGQVLAGTTFSNATGNNRVGTMPNNGAGGTITPRTTNQTKAAGYYNTDIVVPGEPNLLPENIRIGKTMYNIPGSLDPMTYTRLTSTIEQVGPTPGTDNTFRDLIEIPKDKTTRINDYDGMILGLLAPNSGSEQTSAGLLFRNAGVTNYNYIHQIVGYYVDLYMRTAEYKYSSWEIDMVNKRFRYVENGVARTWATIGRVDWTKPIYLTASFRVGQGYGANAGRGYVTFPNTTVISY